MPVKMTRSEYEAKYGSAPKPTAAATPVKMTRTQYESTYGEAPKPTVPEKTLGDKLGDRYRQGVHGVADQLKKGNTGISPILPIPGGRTFLRAAGAAGGAVGDIIGAGIEKITPDSVEKKIGEVIAPVAAPIVKTGKKIFGALENVSPETAQDVKDAANATNLFVGGAAAKVPVKVATKAVEPVIEAAGKAGGGAAESLIANVNRIKGTERQEFKKMTGVSEEEWLRDRGIISTRGNTVEELMNNSQKLYEDVDLGLEKIPGNFRDSSITNVAEEVAGYARSVEDPLSSRMAQLAEKAKGVGLTTKEINEVKRYYERNVKMGYLRDPAKVSAEGARATNRDNKLREFLFGIADKGGFSNLREINKEIQANKFLAYKIAGVMESQGANNALSLTDWIAIMPGLVDPKFLAGFVGKKILSSEGVRAFAARALAGFPNRKPLPAPNFAEIEKRAADLLARESAMRETTQQAALLVDELMKAGYTIGPGERGFIMQNPVPLTRQEQMMIRAAKNKQEQEAMARYILEQRAEGKAVGEGFTVKDVENTPLLNPQPTSEMGTIDFGGKPNRLFGPRPGERFGGEEIDF